MITKIPMPSGGTNTDRLRVIAWKKQVGDQVSRGDVLLEVETDKAVLEVESFARGTLLKQAVPEGEFAAVGEVIAFVGNPQDANDLETSAAKESPVHELDDSRPTDGSTMSAAPGGPERLVEPSSTPGVRATPAAKKSIRELGVSIAAVYASTGKETLHADDVARFVAARRQLASAESKTFDLQPLTMMRRNIAERMQIGASVPTFAVEVEVDMSSCTRLRSEMNARRNGDKLAYHDVISKCAAIASRSYPLVNASFTEEGIRIFRSVNVGIAVSLDEGLVVPVVTDVGRKDLITVATENAENIRRVRSGKFDPDLLALGTLTISNLGSYAITRFRAILNPPQSCILAIGSIQSRPVWREGGWREFPVMSITGTFDHRVMDGAYGARFLQELKNLLEHPQSLFNY